MVRNNPPTRSAGDVTITSPDAVIGVTGKPEVWEAAVPPGRKGTR